MTARPLDRPHGWRGPSPLLADFPLTLCTASGDVGLDYSAVDRRFKSAAREPSLAIPGNEFSEQFPDIPGGMMHV